MQKAPEDEEEEAEERVDAVDTERKIKHRVKPKEKVNQGKE